MDNGEHDHGYARTTRPRTGAAHRDVRPRGGREAHGAFGEFGKPLQHVINAYAYGDVWQRSALPLATKSLAMVAMMAAAGHANELRVHLKGALKNGCSVEQIQEILLLVTLYCGIPAANEAHRVAADVLREEKLL